MNGIENNTFAALTELFPELELISLFVKGYRHSQPPGLRVARINVLSSSVRSLIASL